MSRVITLFLCIALPVLLPAQTNEGTDFWMGFMDHVDNDNEMVVMITSAQNTTGTIEIPLQNWSETFTVTANQVTIIDMPSSAETVTSERNDQTGIHITSATPVAVYAHQFHNARSEAAMILPVASLGDEYFVMTYQGSSPTTSIPRISPSQFMAVAVEDGTEITVEVSDFTKGGKLPRTVFIVRLNKGESYQVQGADAHHDMTGSWLKANKPFAVFGGVTWTEVPVNCGFRDNLYEQMYPLSTWGREFIMAPSATAPFDLLRILAAENNTRVFIDNNQVATLDRGEFYTTQIQRRSAYIRGTKPILVAQYNIGNTCNTVAPDRLGDPSMVLLNTIAQTRDQVTLYASKFENITDNYINLIVQSADTSTAKLNGGKIRNFTAVFSNPDFAYTVLKVNPGSHTITVDGCGLIATSYGYGDVESYSYSSGASFREINNSPIPEGACLNDTVIFDSGLGGRDIEVFWDLGTFTTTAHTFSNIYTELGSHPVTLIIHDLCLDTYDTLSQNLLVTLRQAIAAEGDTSLCAGGTVQLFASDLPGARYEWKGPNDFFSEEQNPVIQGLDLNGSGQYLGVGIISGCATHPAAVSVTVRDPQITLGNDTIFCAENPYRIHLDVADAVTFLWDDGSRAPSREVTEGGYYWVEIRDDINCTARDSLFVTERCPTTIFFPNAFSPNDDGINDEFRPVPKDVTSYELHIYNRWGKLIFSSLNPEDAWDGTFKGSHVAEGVYVWMVKFSGTDHSLNTYQHQRSGTVTLIR